MFFNEIHTRIRYVFLIVIIVLIPKIIPTINRIINKTYITKGKKASQNSTSNHHPLCCRTLNRLVQINHFQVYRHLRHLFLILYEVVDLIH